MRTENHGGDAVERLLLRQTALIMLSSRQPSEKRLEDHLRCLLYPEPHHNWQNGRLSDSQRVLISEILQETRF